MKTVWSKLGQIVYRLTLPGIYLVLMNSKRTRLVLLCKDKVLVVKPWLGNGRWSLPGGGIKKNESAEDALSREVKEEVGFKIPEKKYKKITNATYRQDGLKFSYTLFGCIIKKQVTPTISQKEIVEAKWVSWDSLSVRNANNDVITALKRI